MTTTYLSLDVEGTQAGVYPAEDILWVQGPPINDPADQGVAQLGAGQYTRPPVPRSAAEAQAADDHLNELINGETSNEAIAEHWVNPHVYGPQGFGPWNNPGVFETGHSQNVVSNPAAEQGWGVGPARAWAHYPIEDSPNDTRNFGTHFRNGQLPYDNPGTALYYRTQLAWEQQWAGYKKRSPVAPVVQVAPSVPYVQTVPTYGGGDVQYPGVDYPYDFAGVSGVY